MSFRDEMNAVADQARSTVIEGLGLRLHSVTVRRRLWSGEELGLGTPVDTDVELTPRPRVKPAPEFKGGEGGRREAGDLVVDKISATFTLQQLAPSDLGETEEALWLVDGQEYMLVARPEEGFLGWKVRLTRRGGRP